MREIDGQIVLDFSSRPQWAGSAVRPEAQTGKYARACSNVRFGSFKLDLRAAELRKNGHKIRLQEQPFQILLELLRRPGEVVSREEIRKKLWADDTVVEFDHSINAAVKRLRASLQGSAEKPHYIETLTRRAIGSSRRYRGMRTLFRRCRARSGVLRCQRLLLAR